RCGKLFANGFSHVGAFESLPKNMCESTNLVHQKSDRYRIKGMALRYCQNAVFQAFAGVQNQSLIGAKLLAPKRFSASRPNHASGLCAEGATIGLNRRLPPA